MIKREIQSILITIPQQGIATYINGEIGEVILGKKHANVTGISVFQSMGNALEDGVMANLIYQKVIKS